MSYKAEIPSKEDLKILEELKKYSFVYAILKDDPAYSLHKIDKVFRAFYTPMPKNKKGS